MREPGSVSIYLCGPTVYAPPHLGHGRQNIVYDVLVALPALDRPRRAARLQRHRHRRPDHQPGQRRAAPVAGDHGEVRGRVVRRPGPPRRRPARRHAARHRVRRRDGRDDRRARRARRAPTPPTTASTCPSRRSTTTGCWPTSRSTRCSSAAASARSSAPSCKRHPADFVLWKLAKPGEPSWPSPWGEGRPGWHSECVVMSLDLLGEGFDLHCGGEDLRFPHHENERAQAVALGKRFANHWMHHAFVVDVEGEKMSKSLGNVDNLLDVLDRFDDRSYRLLLLQSHYRSPVRVGVENLQAAETTVAGLDAFAARSTSVADTTRDEADPGVIDAFVVGDGRRPRHAGGDGAAVRHRAAGQHRARPGRRRRPAARRRGPRDRRRRSGSSSGGPATCRPRSSSRRRRSTWRGRPRTTPPPTPSGPRCRPTAGSSRRSPEGPPSGADAAAPLTHADHPARRRLAATVGSPRPAAARRARPDADVGASLRAGRGARPPDAGRRRSGGAAPARPFGHQPGLDGLRALAVIVVILYHGGFPWIHGGWIGVEVFFVVSGFLITTLLLEERERAGRVALGSFWVRRARRLLPALGVMLVAVAAVTLAVGTAAQRGELRRDLPWSIFYLGNWGQIVGGIPYYAADPPLLRHLWSLAIEEQFYLVWPLVFVGLARTGLSNQAIARLLGGIAVAVMVWVVLAARRRARPRRRVRRRRPRQLHVPVDVHPGRRAAARLRRGVRLAAVAVAGADGRRGPPGRVLDVAGGVAIGVLGCIAVGRRADRGLRVPVAAAAGVGAVARRRARRRPPGRGRDAPGAGLPAARRRRRAQLRPVPVALADLRARRRDHGVRPAGSSSRWPHGRRRRAVLPLRRGAGPAGRAGPVVANGRRPSGRRPVLVAGLRRGPPGRRATSPSTRSTAPPAAPTPRSTRRPRRWPRRRPLPACAAPVGPATVAPPAAPPGRDRR